MATAGNTINKLQKFAYSTANNTMVHNTDVVVQGNLTVRGTQTYAQTQTLLVQDNIITLNASINQSGIPLFDAGIEIDRGSEQNVSFFWKESEGAWKFTNDGVNFETLGGGSAGLYANLAYTHANAAFVSANNVAPQVQPAYSHANAAYTHANAAFVSANNVAPQVQPAFDKANAAFNFANTTTAWGTRQSFVATAGQTVFNIGSGYLAGYIDVYYNGIKLYGGDDYTANDGLSVTLTNPALVNDIIEVVGFGANVPVANIYVLNSTTSFVNRQTFFATNGQTTFTPTQSYRVGYIDVYYNGLKMVIPDDVVANNGTTIEFIGLTPTTNDVIEIVGLTPNVALANAIPITGGSVSGNLLPAATNTYYLGSETQRWKSLYVSSNSIDIDGLVLSNSGGTLAVTSAAGAPSTFIDTFARGQANAAFNSANNVAPQVQPAFDRANAAFAAANNVNVYGANTAVNSFFAIPQGTDAQRPASPQVGSLRYNTSNGYFEAYTNVGWIGFIGLTPTITAVSPTSFTGNSGTSFTISGSTFMPDAQVKFVSSNGAEYLASTVTFANSYYLQATTPKVFTVAEEPLSIKVVQNQGLSIGSLLNAIDCGGVPSWTNAAGQIGGTIYDGTSSSTTVIATDPEGGPVSYSLSSGTLPTGLSLGSSNGIISGTTANSASNTTFNFSLAASDFQQNQTTRSFSMSVLTKITLTDYLLDSSGLALYQLDSNILDASGNYNGTGAAAGSLTYNTTNKKFGSASFSANGANCITLPTVRNAYPLSVSAWIYTPSSWPSGFNEIVNGSIAGQRLSMGVVDWDNNGTRQITIMYGGTNHWTFGSNLSTSTWYHVVFSIPGNNNSGHAVYLNGVNQTASNRGGGHGGAAGWVLGGNAGGSEIFGGLIDQVRIFNKALNSTEAQNLYNYELARAL